MILNTEYKKNEGKDKQSYTIIKIGEAQQTTWITVQSEQGKTFIYGIKAFKNLFKKV